MSGHGGHDDDDDGHGAHEVPQSGILANKNLWLAIGFGLFILIGLIIPAPQGMKDLADDRGYANALLAKDVVGSGHHFLELYEHDDKILLEELEKRPELKAKIDKSIEKHAFERTYKNIIKDSEFRDVYLSNEELKDDAIEKTAKKMKIVIAVTIMIVVFFATDAMPIGAAALLIPTFGYLFALSGPTPSDIAKDFFSDAAFFILGVLALGYAVAEVGLHSRIAALILGKFRGFKGPIFGITIVMAMVGSFISAHALAAFLAPVMAAIYYGSVKAAQKKGEIVGHDPALAKMLLLALTFAMNVGGTGSPVAGGRNAIMMNYFSEYDVPISFAQWMIYGFPMVPIMGLAVGLYVLTAFKPKVKDLTPGIQAIKDELKERGAMDFKEKVMAVILVVVLVLWIAPEFAEGLGMELPFRLGIGGPSMFALVLPPLLRVVNWEKMLKGIAWDAWFVYIGAMGLGAFMKSTGAAEWIAQGFLSILPGFFTHGIGLWISVSALSGLITNFMSDGATTALLGPIAINMGLLAGQQFPATAAMEPWATGLATAFATSFAHFLIIGTPNNVICYGLGRYPDTGERILSPMDFPKYGFAMWIISMIIMWVFTFGIVYTIAGFPEGLFDAALEASQAGK